MKKILLCTAAVSMLAVSLGSPAAEGIPDPHEATYRIDRKGIKAEMVSIFSKKGEAYTLVQSTDVKGIASLLQSRPAVETVRFNIKDGNAVAGSYKLDDGTKKGENSFEMNFSADGKITVTSGTSNNTISPDTPTIDPGTALIQLGLELAKKPDSKTLQYTVLEMDKAILYRFSVAGSEKVKTRAGEFDTIKVDLQRGNSKRPLSYWLAPSHGMIAVRTTQSAKGKQILLVELEKYTPK